MKKQFWIFVLFFAALIGGFDISSQRALALGLAFHPSVAFDFLSTSRRYPAPDDYLRILETSFPLAGGPALDENHCHSTDDVVKSLLGGSQASTGEPVFQQPGVPFVEWWEKCLRVSIESDLSGALVQASQKERYLSPSAEQALMDLQARTLQATGRKLRITSLHWNQLSDETKLDLGKNIFEHLGLEGLTPNENDAVSGFIQEIEKNHTDMTVRTALIELTYQCGMQDYFLLRQ